jgi:hypothetical protein
MLLLSLFLRLFRKKLHRLTGFQAILLVTLIEMLANSNEMIFPEKNLSLDVGPLLSALGP